MACLSEYTMTGPVLCSTKQTGLNGLLTFAVEEEEVKKT